MTQPLTLFNIQHFSVHDGPGVRTVVFFKGCNLRCRWCHNPESLRPTPELLFYQEKCIGCGGCFSACPKDCHKIDDQNVHTIDREQCDRCFACADKCYAEALTRVGESVDLDYVMGEIRSNLLYFQNSGGGVTFSGGECMLEPERLFELLSACKAEGIHTAVDTAGHVPWSSFERVLPVTDLFLYDLKAMDPEVHKNLTGADNRLILENYQKLLQAKAHVWVRVPYVPGYNHKEMEGLAAFVGQNPPELAEVLPFHGLGISKYAALGLGEAATLHQVGKMEIQPVQDLFDSAMGK